MRGCVAVLAALSSGCGLATQVVLGFDREDVERRTVTHAIAVEANPAGAQISRRDPSGATRSLGAAPLSDPLTYEVEDRFVRPAYYGFLGGSAVDLIVTLILLPMCASDVSDAGGSFKSPDGSFIHFTCIGGALAGMFTIGDWISVLMALGDEGERKASTVVGGELRYVYAAKKAGFDPVEAAVVLPRDHRVELLMPRTRAAVVTPPPPPRPSRTTIDARSFVIAVMSVEDVNAQRAELALQPALLMNLTDQLRVFIAERHIRTIDKGAQEVALRSQITDMKEQSFQACFDDACQIELGKALAASHILRARVTRFGSKCVLNAELIDLKSEVAIGASSSSSTCAEEGFLGMSRDVARGLFGD
jgi:hypothetical protein